MDPYWIQALRVVHIVAGFGAFFIAPVPLATAKGGAVHRRWGKRYFWLMAIVTVTALILAFYRPVAFLAMIAVFSFYFAFRGYRVLDRKHPDRGDQPAWIDWVGAVVALVASIGLVWLGLTKPSPLWVRLSTVALAFGTGGAVVAITDLVAFVRPPRNRQFWWFTHMGGMVGSYIAAVSAFSVVNFGFLPPVVRWLWPSVIGIPLLSVWIAYYRRKFSGHPGAAMAT
jgi:hypothetical protein